MLLYKSAVLKTDDKKEDEKMALLIVKLEPRTGLPEWLQEVREKHGLITTSGYWHNREVEIVVLPDGLASFGGGVLWVILPGMRCAKSAWRWELVLEIEYLTIGEGDVRPNWKTCPNCHRATGHRDLETNRRGIFFDCPECGANWEISENP